MTIGLFGVGVVLPVVGAIRAYRQGLRNLRRVVTRRQRARDLHLGIGGASFRS